MSADQNPVVERATYNTELPGLASIPMPDHWVRKTLWWQIYSRGARPALDWVSLVGAAWSLFVGDWYGSPMSDSARLIVLGFAAGLFGVRTFEKVRGVA